MVIKGGLGTWLSVYLISAYNKYQKTYVQTSVMALDMDLLFIVLGEN